MCTPAQSKLCSSDKCNMCFDRSFQSHPRAVYWVYDMNGDRVPRNVLKTSTKKFWFCCSHIDHPPFQSYMNSIITGRWCQRCANEKSGLKRRMNINPDESFAIFPESEFWNYELNGDITPENVRKSSQEKFWFNCTNDHPPFQTFINNVIRGHWCSKCGREKSAAKQKICTDPEKSFAKSPKAKLWNFELNGDVRPEDVFAGSTYEYWFTCDDCEHDYKKSLNSISKSGCPYCAHFKLCENDICQMCENNSFQSCIESKYFSDKNIDPITLKSLKARDIFKGSSTKYLFNHECGHEFTRSPDSVSHGNFDSFCPFCSGRELCDNECESCFNRSFASHEKSQFLDSKHNARQIFKNSAQICDFNCPCGHTFTSYPATISDGTFCPYCGNKKLCETDCEMCFNKSFASSTYAFMWADDADPRQVFKRCSSKEYKFKCKFDHEITALPRNVDLYGGCSSCKHITQTRLLDWLKINVNHKVKPEQTFKWCRKIDLLRFDFSIEDLKLIIELDGNQHFKQVWKWDSPEFNLENDVFKMKKAKENGYSVIRILQMDVYLDKNNWQEKLSQFIKLYDIPTIIYIDNDKNNYESHKKHIE